MGDKTGEWRKKSFRISEHVDVMNSCGYPVLELFRVRISQILTKDLTKNIGPEPRLGHQLSRGHPETVLHCVRAANL